jgi:hypothetical protein
MVSAAGRRTSLFVGDPSPVDQAAGFRSEIDWGDGTAEVVNGPAAATARHVYTTTGVFAASVVAVDKDGGRSVAATHTFRIDAAQIQGDTLAVGGTTANDRILSRPASADGLLEVFINGALQGRFRAGRILVFGQDGDDTVVLADARLRGRIVRIKAGGAGRRQEPRRAGRGRVGPRGRAPCRPCSAEAISPPSGEPAGRTTAPP